MKITTQKNYPLPQLENRPNILLTTSLYAMFRKMKREINIVWDAIMDIETVYRVWHQVFGQK